MPLNERYTKKDGGLTVDQQPDFYKRTYEFGGGAKLELGNRTLIMGILNATPDSFSDGGRYTK